MAKPNSKVRGAKSSRIETIKISRDIIDAIEAIPDKRVWTPEVDALLLKYGGVKPWGKLSKVLGYSHNACRERFLTLGGEL